MTAVGSLLLNAIALRGLDLRPHLTNDDIAEFYDRLTRIREESYLRQFGHALSSGGAEEVRDQYQQTAATG